MARRVLADPHPNRAPRGMWLAAGTPTDRPYPCRCNPDGCRRQCPCNGRHHTIDLPARCCARRAADTTARQEAKGA